MKRPVHIIYITVLEITEYTYAGFGILASKAPVSSCLSVCLSVSFSACINSPPSGRFLKFCIDNFHKTLSRKKKKQVLLQSDNIERFT